MNIKLNNIEKINNKDFLLYIKKLEFESKKITGLLGNNGSGKTTLLNIIAGLISYEKGEILYNNAYMDKKLKKDITLVYQKPYMLNRTVMANLDYPLKIRNFPKEERQKKIIDMAKKLSIENLLDKNATCLSGGEMQKVQIGRGLIFNPKLLLLDEPTSGVAKENMEMIENLIVDYKNDGGTVIIVTHQEEQKKICDKLITLEGGKLHDNSWDNYS